MILVRHLFQVFVSITLILPTNFARAAGERPTSQSTFSSQNAFIEHLRLLTLLSKDLKELRDLTSFIPAERKIEFFNLLRTHNLEHKPLPKIRLIGIHSLMVGSVKIDILSGQRLSVRGQVLAIDPEKSLEEIGLLLQKRLEAQKVWLPALFLNQAFAQRFEPQEPGTIPPPISNTLALGGLAGATTAILAAVLIGTAPISAVAIVGAAAATTISAIIFGMIGNGVDRQEQSHQQRWSATQNRLNESRARMIACDQKNLLLYTEPDGRGPYLSFPFDERGQLGSPIQFVTPPRRSGGSDHASQAQAKTLQQKLDSHHLRTITSLYRLACTSGYISRSSFLVMESSLERTVTGAPDRERELRTSQPPQQSEGSR